MLEQALTDLEGQPSFEIVRIYGLRALAFQAKGDEKKALASLRQALVLAEPENRAASFVREGPAMEKLLRSARAKSIAPAFIQRLLTTFDSRRKQKPAPAPVIEALIEPLSERELEVLQVLDDPLSTPEIAEQLVVSANTVRTHIKNIIYMENLCLKKLIPTMVGRCGIFPNWPSAVYKGKLIIH